ncbi:lysylphosphatidylglycerol synthase domain-containing protein [Demequina sp. B12]|uniref:lysylphosphatidylglycerol synthase transmembrane domain-containing protein n=1 Tax=Demequina sp. B12 TaxID=2992757 RepID=UPI00237A6EBB|nr:lysylphosphatidylglycerol synthase transmembrane domain-containing protein [Demequina sp. B12]MDE0572170.1 lysylphosphatidylglycerol synthase domain-containing protein [Demequina sp. B12]
MAGSEETQESPAPTEQPDPLQGVTVFDVPQQRVHRFTDLLTAVATLVGIVVVLLLGAYGNATTAGFTEDVQGIARVLQRLLVAPVNLFSGIVTLVVPAAIITDLAIRREPRRILEVLGSGVLAFIATVISAFTTLAWGSEELLASLSVPGAEGEMVVQLPAYLAAVGAMLTAAGLRSTRAVLAWSWPLLWISGAVGVVSGIVTLPAAIVVVLIGRATGLTLRYLLGSSADRAYGGALADGIRRAGFEPRRIVRADRNDGYEPEEADAVSAALGRTRAGRVYAVTTVEGHHLVVLALDGDQQAAGFLNKFWQTVRFRGIDARTDVSLRQTAESTALVSHAARTAGVRTARVLGMSQTRDTMLIVYQRPTAVQPLSETPVDDITDEVLDATWAQLGHAHNAGIAHRKLSADTILVSDSDGYGAPVVWITSWDLGEVATSTLSRRLDNVQLLVALGSLVGAERAAASAFRALGESVVEQVAPLLQSIVLPRDTRATVKANKSLMQDLRSEIVAQVPDAEVQEQNIARFGWRTIFTVAALIVAGSVVIASLNTQQIIEALQEANWWWIGGAIFWGMLTFVGAGLALLAFSPVNLPPWRVMLAQVAAAYIAVAVPAGIGPAALNLRLLTKRRVPTPLGVATVALVQVSAVIVTVLGLLILTLFTGSEGTLASLPSTSVLIGLGVVAAVVVAFMLVPKVRRWVLAKIMPPIRQTWPRLVQILGQPWRLALGLTGNLLQTAAYVGAFYCTLEAFGQDLAIMDVAVVYFLSNAVGAVVPTPGGLGAVELALGTGLTSAGVPVGVATSVVLIYRFITYWLRIPLGWGAMTWLQRKGEL